MICARFLAVLLVLLAVGCASGPGGDRGRLAPEAMPKAAFARALGLMDQGDLAAAEAAFRLLAQRYPHYSGPWTNLGILAAGRGDHSSAERLLAAALKANPSNAVATAALATLRYQRGEVTAALGLYQQALALRPAYAEAHLNLAVLYDKALHQPASALRHYRRYQQLSGGEDLLVAAWILALEKADSKTHYKVVRK